MNALVGASESDPDLGFMARLMALCSLPRTNPRNQLQYKRVNGPYKLIMTATGITSSPLATCPGYCWPGCAPEAVRTQSRELVLGRSLSEFMRKLGVISSDSGGSWGIRTRLKNQMDRLFSATVSLIYEDDGVKARVSSLVADHSVFGGTPSGPTSRCYGRARSGWVKNFSTRIIRHPVPLDMNILKALKRSSLGLDLYLWLVYRTFALKSPLQLTWRQVYRQFGVSPAKAEDNSTVQHFRKDCLRELKKIQAACRT